MSKENVQLLQSALRSRFKAEEAQYLSLLLRPCLYVETIDYMELDLPRETKKEYILMAFEERLLIPVQDKEGYGWDDCGLRMEDGERYSMPRLSKVVLKTALSTGRLDSEPAIKELIAVNTVSGDRDFDQINKFLQALKSHSTQSKFEGGLMLAISQSMDLKEDLHDLVELLILLGVISPSKKSSMAKGLSWFEINPCLYWDGS